MTGEAVIDGFGPEAVPGARGLRLVTPGEFAGDPAPEAIVPGVVFESSLHTLNGASKSGKSVAAFQLGMSVASGAPFLELPVQRCPVLLLSLELAAGVIRERAERIARDTRTPMPAIGSDFHLFAPTRDAPPQGAHLLDDDGADLIAETIHATRAGLVIFDTLYRFIPGVDPNSNGEMGEVIGRLNRLAHSTGAALLVIDHVAKGEFSGTVSQSGVGAQVKGGGAGTIIRLTRTSKEDGGRWQLDSESWFTDDSEPLHYERPRLENGERGYGCIRCGAAQAHGIDLATLSQLFHRHGVVNGEARPVIASKAKLREALKAESHCSGNDQGDRIVGAILRDYCVRKGSAWRTDRPVVIEDGPRNATVFTWRGEGSP